MKALKPLLAEYLGRQRWFAGTDPKAVTVVSDEELFDRARRVVVEADGARYQLIVGLSDNAPEFLHGHDDAVIGEVDDGQIAYDGLLDPDIARSLLELVSEKRVTGRHVRPIGAEQSNTSLVYDDRLILKVFRRLHEGLNPDVEVTTALSDQGFGHVASTFSVWRQDGYDLAVLQEYLAGGTEGWALALTSLRDFYAARTLDPAAAGGDFGPEAQRLGDVTAQLHLALAEAFGTTEPDTDSWLGLMTKQLDDIAANEPWQADATAAFERYRQVAEAGPSIRVHGDYHLGQVMRTDKGWYVLDFEGEPARPLTERSLPSSPFKDVAGMLRSFDYAARVALSERGEQEQGETHEAKAMAWQQRVRESFLRGYLSSPGIEAILPGDEESIRAGITAWELDKAVYEVGYERGHRPDWVGIPLAAIDRLLGR
jgi:maltokinase